MDKILENDAICTLISPKLEPRQVISISHRKAFKTGKSGWPVCQLAVLKMRSFVPVKSAREQNVTSLTEQRTVKPVRSRGRVLQLG